MYRIKSKEDLEFISNLQGAGADRGSLQNNQNPERPRSPHSRG